MKQVEQEWMDSRGRRAEKQMEQSCVPSVSSVVSREERVWFTGAGTGAEGTGAEVGAEAGAKAGAEGVSEVEEEERAALKRARRPARGGADP